VFVFNFVLMTATTMSTSLYVDLHRCARVVNTDMHLVCVYMYVCMYVYISACMYVCMYICLYVCLYARVGVRSCTAIPHISVTSPCVCVAAPQHPKTILCACVRTRVRVYECVYVHMCMYCIIICCIMLTGCTGALRVGRCCSWQ
jgi:hypothetical protein